MDGFDRIYDLHRILSGRKTAIPVQDILEKMECSRATFNRIKRHMLDFLGAPIVYKRDQGGYVYEQGSDYELPGLWFSEQEIHGLLAMQSLLSDLNTGALKEAFTPIEKRFHRLLENNAISPTDIQNKIRFIGVGTRLNNNVTFVPVINATLQNQTLDIIYLARATRQKTCRTISPQRIINYRNNWYLDAWCHLRSGYRTFAMECILESCSSQIDYHRVDFEELDSYLQSTYGIFSGGESDVVSLRFSAETTSRIAEEQWHPLQESTLNDDGTYTLSFPFNKNQPEELLRDILAHGSDVRIESPKALQSLLKEKLKNTLNQY